MLQAATHRRLLHSHTRAGGVFQRPLAAHICQIQKAEDFDEHVCAGQYRTQFVRLNRRLCVCHSKQFLLQVSDSTLNLNGSFSLFLIKTILKDGFSMSWPAQWPASSCISWAAQAFI